MADLSQSLNIEISASSISNIENDRHSPNSDIVIALSEFFNVSTDWLLKGEEFQGNKQSDNQSLKKDIDELLSEDDVKALKAMLDAVMKLKNGN